MTLSYDEEVSVAALMALHWMGHISMAHGRRQQNESPTTTTLQDKPTTSDQNTPLLYEPAQLSIGPTTTFETTNMKVSHRVLPFIAFRYASAMPVQDSGIAWGPCKTIANTTTNLSCGTLDVPLDYTSPNVTDTLELKLVRSKATKGPFLGTVLYNPGGPGYAGRNILHGTSDILHSYVSCGDVQSGQY